MEGNKKYITCFDININKLDEKKKDNSRQSELIQKFQKVKLNHIYSKIINIILFEIIFISLIKGRHLSYEHYIEINVYKAGYNQIISDEYRGTLPSKVLINDAPLFMDNKVVLVAQTDYKIKLKWDNTLSNLSYMFSNLDTIRKVYIYYMFGNNCNMSYMFYNCHNLIKIDYSSDYTKSNMIRDMSGMFYNCTSLISFQFTNLFINAYDRVQKSEKVGNETRTYWISYYYYSNLSYMFYNCNNLNSISFDSHELRYISDMKGMFYNCFSLRYLDLSQIKTNSYVDLSYMFYNCTNLVSFENNGFHAKNMEYMFYNCISLKNISIGCFSLKYCHERDDKADSLICKYYENNNPITINIDYYLVNMAYLFYNCTKLENIEGSFYNFHISDIQEMFYNCISLKILNFNPYYIINANMAKLFYNCQGIERITLISSVKCYPNSLYLTFYNCISLRSLEISNIQTDYVEDISYMLFNCKNLQYFSIVHSNFSNLLITNMKGMFENCESLVSLDLSLFYTPKVEIMWDMFKNCKSLEYLNISDFDTSKVTDMESMFEGCSSLISLNINNFKTSNVRYMNKMFRDCKNLQSLYFNNINSESLGTMQQMFYNCRSLKYLNIYSLTERVQSITEMFEGTSTDFTFCVKEEKDIPKIFEIIYEKIDTKRDCSENCYGLGNRRPIIPQQKICCPMFEYNGTCCDKCPKRMNATSDDKICKPFNCSPLYFNYEQDGCLDEIPDGYYENDTEYKTIDRCYKTCETCRKGPTSTKAYCSTCVQRYPFFFFDNCLESCENGYYNKSGFLECKCITKECSNCTEESLENGFCVSCNIGYYPKSDENEHFKNYIKCYQDPTKYYFNNETQKYHPCYDSCQECYGEGNLDFHNCSVCDSNNTFAIIKNISGNETKNCYENCTYYYYFYDGNKYNCTEKDECPQEFSYLVVDIKECVSSCDVTSGYYKRLKNECYKECPPGISIQSENDTKLCKSQCSYEYPFELIEKEKCVASCSIMDRSKKLCVTSYFENRTNLEIQEIIHEDVKRDLLEKFNYRIITENETVLIEENKTIYEIMTTRNKNPNSNTTSINLGECEDRLKEYYAIEQDEYLYMLIIDTYVEGKTGPVSLYEVFYPLFNSPVLFQLDLSICEGLKIIVSYSMELENPELYDKNNPIYNDMCYPYSSKDGVDMILTDVQREYIDGNKSICDEDCVFGGYIDEKVDCNCDIKESLPPISEIKIDKDKLYKFANIKNIANFGALKCINLLKVKERMIYNIGIYSFIPTFISYIVCIILFFKVDFNIIKEKIKELLYAIQNLKYIKKKKVPKVEPKGEPKIEKKETEQVEEKSNEPLNVKYYNILEPAFVSLAKLKNFEIPGVKMNDIDDIIKKTNLKEKKPLKHLKQNIKPKEKKPDNNNKHENHDKNIDNNELEKNLNINNDIVIHKKKSKHHPPIKNGNPHNEKKIEEKNPVEKNDEKKNNDEQKSNKDNKKLSEKEIKRIKEILAYNDKELNELDFKLAIKYDNRNILKMYFSFLKTDHIIIKILNSNDYNSRFIKIFLCFYNFSLSYTINALFFNDDTIHQILEDEGKFNFLYQLPQILYSSIISYLLGMILDFLALSEDNIIELKAERVPKKAIEKAKSLLRILKYKFTFFFILSFIFLFFFWYYVICFCAVYKNTQYHLFKDSIIGFVTGFLTPIGTKLVPLIFRIFGLKRKSKYFFFISKIIQIFL